MTRHTCSPTAEQSPRAATRPPALPPSLPDAYCYACPTFVFRGSIARGKNCRMGVNVVRCHSACGLCHLWNELPEIVIQKSASYAGPPRKPCFWNIIPPFPAQPVLSCEYFYECQFLFFFFRCYVIRSTCFAQLLMCMHKRQCGCHATASASPGHGARSRVYYRTPKNNTSEGYDNPRGARNTIYLPAHSDRPDILCTKLTTVSLS